MNRCALLEYQKINLLPIIKSLVFFIISLVLAVYFKSGLSEYNSVIDKYLNYNYIVFIRIFSVLNLIISLCFLILFILSIIKRNNNKISKIVSSVLIVIFIIVNISSVAYIINFQANEDKVINTIPDSVGSYVDLGKVFKISPDDDYYQEQTVFNKVSTEIPVNYNVQQSNSDNSIKTSCIEITDDKLLSEYYDEQQKRYSQNNIVEFNSFELNSMSADKGFYYLTDNYNLDIIVIKGNKLFDVYLFSKDIKLTDGIIQQIAAL